MTSYRTGVLRFAAAALLSAPLAAVGQTELSEVALFHRCFSHLTQLRPRLSDPLLAQVKAGSKTALQACTEVLDKARFSADAGTRIADVADPVAKAVLHNMHQFHGRLAREQVIFNPSGGTFEHVGAQTWYEDSPLGTFLSRALFSPTHNVDSITTGSDFLQPIRATMDPPRQFGGIPNTAPNQESDWHPFHPFAPKGELYGIRNVSLEPVDFFPAIRFPNLNSLPDLANLGVPPAATTTFQTLNLPDITAVRGPLAETTLFAMRIRGTLIVPAEGSYTLYLDVDDGGRLYIDGTRMIDRGAGEGSVVTSLTAGNHAFEVWYRQGTGSARLNLRWAGPGISKQIIPASALSGITAEYYTESKRAPLRFTGSQGGGILGNHNYLFTTYLQASNFVPDGAILTNRSWARAVLFDTLCREIPVVRKSDVESFVVPGTSNPFRESAECNACHASIDRQAGLLRSLRWNVLGNIANPSPTPDLIGILNMNYGNAALPERRSWEDTADPDYALRAPHGRLFFRNYLGNLIDIEVRTFEELGAAIRAQDDHYICFAKNYYEYFTGIEAVIGDPGDATYPQLTAQDQYHRQRVIDLGLALKNHKSLRQLILDIMSSETYRMSDYGITYAGGD